MLPEYPVPLYNFNQYNLPVLLLLVATVAGGFVLGGSFRALPQISDDPALRRLSRLLLWSAVLIGLALRLYGADFGLPNPYHPDELQKAHFLKKMMRDGTINPHFNLQPPLLLYLTWPLSILLQWLQVFPENVVVRNLLAGRLVSVVFGTLSLPVLYSIGKRLSAPIAGGAAALLMAVFPLAVTNSRYMKEDALFIFFMLACLLFVLKAVDERRPTLLYAAGLMAGFSLGSKYTGCVCFLLIIAAPFLGRERFSFFPDRRFFVHSLLALPLIPIGAVLTAPYLLEGWKNIELVLEGFASESRHAMRGHMKIVVSPWSQLWMFHLGRSLIPGAGLLPMTFAMIAIGVAIRRWNSRGLYLIALTLLFYVPAEWARSKPPPQPDRYVMACLPFIALFIGDLLKLFRERWHDAVTVRRLSLAALLIAASPFTWSVLYALELRNDTRRQMTEWLANNLPPKSRILTMGGSTYLARIPNRHVGVSLRKALGTDDNDIVQRLRDSKYRYLLTTNLTGTRFRIEKSDVQKETIHPLEVIDSNLPIVVRFVPRYGSYGFHNPVLTLYALKPEGTATEATGSDEIAAGK